MDVRQVQNPLTGLSRWKIFDNLRRSLVPFALVLLLLGWLLSSQRQRLGPNDFDDHRPAFGAGGVDRLRKPKDLPFHLHVGNVGETLVRQAAQAILTVAFLPYDAGISLDADAHPMAFDIHPPPSVGMANVRR